MRSNDRSIVQSVEVRPGAELQNLNEAECVVGGYFHGSISESTLTQQDGDAESASDSNEKNDTAKIAQQPIEPIVVVNCVPCDQPAMNEKSNETEGENFVSLIVDVEEINEVQ